MEHTVEMTGEEIEIMIEHYEEQIKDYGAYSGEDAEGLMTHFRGRLNYYRLADTL